MKTLLQSAQAKAVHAFNAGFCTELPQEARAGRYQQRPGDRFERVRVQVPDGVYRVRGSAWLLTFARARFVEAVLAAPPDFGGDAVIAVDYDAAGVEKKGA
jgi:hypothetical protein